jgi:hypothetical protein
VTEQGARALAGDGYDPDPGERARAIRDAVLALPEVARLSAGALGEVATYLPGDRVPGIRFTPDGTQVHVVLTAAGAEAIPAAAGTIARAAGPGPVHVHIEDVETSRIGKDA